MDRKSIRLKISMNGELRLVMRLGTSELDGRRSSMSGRLGRFFGLIGVAMALLAPATATAATADIIAPSDPFNPTAGSGWQAGTCNDEPAPLGTAADFCSVDTGPQFFEDAGAHPHFGFTQFIVKNHTPGEQPDGALKTVRVDLPVGLSVNPQATDQCEQSDFELNPTVLCAGTEVGASQVWGAAPILGTKVGPIEATVYNIVPPQGEPARFGLNLLGNNIYLQADLAWDSDYHEGFTIHVPALPDLAPLSEGLILANRLTFRGRAGDGTFITTPSTCRGEGLTGPSGHDYSTYLLASSITEEAQPGYSFPTSAFPRFESPIPPGTEPKNCQTIPFEPTIEAAPGTAETNSPAGVAVDLELPHIAGDDSKGMGGEVGEKQESSPIRNATVTLPPGMGLNPSAANGLQTCSDAQFGKGTKSPVACPPQSKVGTVAIDTPALPPESVKGDVFVGEQKSRDPLSGEEYRIFVDAESPRYGISARLIGNVKADPKTGRLTTTFANNPQVPVSSFRLDFDDGPRAVTSSPPTCGPNATTSSMLPWSADAIAPWTGATGISPSASFALAAAPGGGPCAKTMAARPFAPSFATKPASSKAGAFSPLAMNIVRGDGQQELKGVDVTLPPGFTGKLKGIPYCSEAALASAATRSGAEEAKTPSCPAAGLLGSATVLAGTGPAPYKVTGKVFLSGPYHGAPLSLAVLTPATAGPFDLGTVVVRVALFVEPETAQIHAVSDPVPDVFGGAQLSIRSVDVKIDRPDFTLNPTSCGPLATAGTLAGGGADPTTPAAFSSLPVSSPFQPSECEQLGFKPKLVMKLLGGRKIVKRAQHPKFRAVLTARPGDANIGRAAVTLPHSLFLDQGHIRTICTRVQLAAQNCPAGAVYGYAKAQTPLLDDALEGPVYLVSSNNPLPDLLADLHGQVNVRLHGVISSLQTGRIKNVFYPVPDVPVSRFTLNMRGGKKGLLTNSRNLCAHPSFSYLNFKAQNGKSLKLKKLRLRVPACR
jgi:hypothetical protein